MNPNKQSQDKRVIATKKNLLHAFITLLEEKSIEEVTVRELTGRAKVNRGTFYLHYVDKHDLLEKNIDALILELQDRGKAITKTALSGATETEFRQKTVEAFTDIFSYIKENERFFSVLFNGRSSYSFPLKFNTYLRGRLEDQLRSKKTVIPYEHWITAVSFAYQGMIYSWVTNGMKDSPERMGEYGYYFISQSVVEITRGT